MSLQYVQFSDSTQTKIISWFGSPQDPDVWPNQGQVEEDDPRYIEYLNPSPTAEEILAEKQAQKELLLSNASAAMTPVFLALQLGDATDEETLAAKAWRAYYIALQAVDVTAESPEWPVAPT